MNLHTPRSAKLGLALFAALTITLGLVLAARFGGPSLHLHPPVRVSALVDDAGGVPSQADVLVHGVKVGVVAGVAPAGARTRLTLALDAGRARLVHRGATVRIGAKTPLGESFVDLDPGPRPAPPVRAGAILPQRPAVEVDEALRVLDAPARTSLRAVLRTTGRATRSPAAAARVGATLDGVSGTVDALDGLTAALAGQEGAIAQTVTDARTVLGALAARDDDIRGTVRDAHATLAATASAQSALAAAAARLPAVTRATTATLRAAAPLIRAAQPVAERVHAAAPALAGALHTLPSTLDDARAVVAAAPALTRRARPALAALRALAPVAQPALARLAPVLADVVPVVRYLGPRADTMAAWFANTADLGSHGDAKGDWARFFVLFDPSTLLGVRSGAPPVNPYTPPHDAAHNAPYRAGDYPRLQPYAPALAGAPGRR